MNTYSHTTPKEPMHQRTKPLGKTNVKKNKRKDFSLDRQAKRQEL